MDREAKLKMLKELDSKTDWEGLIMKQSSTPTESSSQTKQQKPLRKLSKSEKKKIKLEKQLQEFHDTLKKKNIETVVYDNPDAISNQSSVSRKIKDSTGDSQSQVGDQGIEIDMKKTRYEIMKFGISSLKSQELVDAETSLAISLGAKPNKRQAINYKELQTQRKKDKELIKEQEAGMVKPKLKGVAKKKSQVGKAVSKDKKKQIGGRQNGRNSRLPSRRHNK
ncbi:hypothetical protein Ocin01_08793 [Orchesella cincta]|uniref:Uncharacterized protein n=1 Tax=Orchesella cincta TaxID=48709 RepID=A0A1D2MY30_ORCCI|nr:hypothetical protein Ocin01_08793 [Orchesella cincta]